MYKKPKLELQTTTLWDYPSQHYGSTMQGDKEYKGATPSYIIWNLLQRYTRVNDLVVDPMCGVVVTDLERRDERTHPLHALRQLAKRVLHLVDGFNLRIVLQGAIGPAGSECLG